jgi:hypothetical protein
MPSWLGKSNYKKRAKVLVMIYVIRINRLAVAWPVVCHEPPFLAVICVADGGCII